VNNEAANLSLGAGKPATFSRLIKIWDAERAAGAEYSAALHSDASKTWMEVTDQRHPEIITKVIIEPQTNGEDHTALAAMVRGRWTITPASVEAAEMLARYEVISERPESATRLEENNHTAQIAELRSENAALQERIKALEGRRPWSLFRRRTGERRPS